MSAKGWWILAIIAVVVIFLILFLSGTLTGKAAASVTQCNDRVDNDGDGKCDYSGNRKGCTDGSVKGDAGCASSSDSTEASCIAGSTNCGVGECIRSSTCVNDQSSCTPGTPVSEVCGDGKDNDCNGVVDNGCFTNTCADSDGGQVYNVLGTVSGLLNNTGYNFTDSCPTGFSLKEYYCSGNQYASTTISCNMTGNSTGTCSSGRCI